MSAFLNLLTALGWSLLDNVWQMAALWVAYGLLTRGNNRFSAAEKHNLALLFVLIGSSWFIYTWVDWVYYARDHFISGLIPFSVKNNRWIPYLSGIYLIILVGRFILWLFQYDSRNKIKTGRSGSPVLQSFADCQAKLIGISKKVSVYISDLAETAETSGYLKPLILLPVSVVTKLSPRQLEAILIHELLHIRRNDYVINICMSCFRSIFFFNPFARLFYTAVAKERELACDDGVLEMCYEPDLYAEALFSLERFRQVQRGFSLAADGNKPWLLMERIRRLLRKPDAEKRKLRPLIIFNGVTALFLFCLQPKFPVAVRFVPSPVRSIAVTPARYEMNRIKTEEPDREKRIINRTACGEKKKKPVPEWKPEVSPEVDPVEDQQPEEQTFFADNSEIRNFSNEQAAGPTVEPIPSIPGTPYVPSSSLSYDPVPEILAADSARPMVVPEGMKEIIAEVRLKTTTGLKQMETELKKNNRQFRVLETKNRKLIELHKKNIRPLLQKIQLDMQLKKQEIDRMKIQLQITDEEIIHI